ncbi:ORF6N domain-containing protein [Serratia symbiotica]|uniref:Putative ORF6N domain-containing protein n=1 Tax=Serratia symbiotica SCt-VLC TaxID=1347341 RepID=A0A068RCC6_9GAMM|nr:Putative ORF6N domain-containing protein [Serratia symbiotica SCt-VLC]
MTAQITAETISPITYNQINVITTELLASLYGADQKLIRQNYTHNTDRFVDGKHYFKLTGNELKCISSDLI